METVQDQQPGTPPIASMGRVLRPRRPANAIAAGEAPTDTGASQGRRGKRKVQASSQEPGNDHGNGSATDVSPSTTTGRQPRGTRATAKRAKGNHPVVSQPLFVPLLPPMVIDISHEALSEWLSLREGYEQSVKAQAKITGEPLGRLMTSVRSSFDESLLETLCETTFGIEKDGVTDDYLMQWITEKVNSFQNQSMPMIKELFEGELKMTLGMRDVEAEVINYFHQCNEIIRSNGLGLLFNGQEDGIQKKCKILLHCLPPRIKEMVKNVTSFKDAKAMTSILAFRQVVYDQTLKYELEHRSQASKRRNTDTADTVSTNKRVRPARQSRGQQQAEVASSKLPSTSKSKGCWKCGGDHKKCDCPLVQAMNQKQTGDQHRDLKTNRASAKRIKKCLSEDEKTLTVEGVLEIPYCADSGADKSCIPMHGVRRLQELGCKFTLRGIDPPVECSLADGKKTKISQTALVHLSLRTAAGRVNLTEPVECFVLDSDDDEFLLGNDVLKDALGIDLDRQLELLSCVEPDDGDDIPEDPVVSDQAVDEALTTAIETMIQRALDKGFPQDRVDDLRRVVLAHDIWRLSLGNDPPARVEPMKVYLKPNAKPYKTKARKYAPEMQRFLEEFNETLVRLGWVYENPRSRWACAALPVRKRGGTEFRQTTDYKPVNAQVEVVAGVMPNLDVDLQCVRDSKCFGLFDFIKGYWQLPLDEESQELLSYMTHRKIYTPRRVPQGCSDAALFFQSTMERCFEPLLYKHLLIWIDDLMLFAKDMDSYLAAMDRLFSLLDDFGFKLSVAKSELFTSKVKWCGRLIDGNGVSHDAGRIAALQGLPYPTTAAELQQFLCSTNWMRDSLLDYARLARPLQEVLDAALESAPRRTKRVAAGIPVVLSDEERKAFDSMKSSLSNSATLSFPHPDAEVCLCTDASDIGWAAIVTQVKEWQPGIPVHEQKHEMLICVGGTFTGSQRNWSVIEKEAYPIVSSCDKLGYVLLRPKGFKMYCDHRNLIHVFAPSSEAKKHVKGKLLRWSMKLMEYRYSIEHIDGVSNVWADMVSRWGGQAQVTPTALKRVSLRSDRVDDGAAEDGTADRDEAQPRPMITVRPFRDGVFTWPTVDEIRTSQYQYKEDQPKDCVLNASGLWCRDSRVWIPTADVSLVKRLLVIAHCGPQGHRGRSALMLIMNKRFLVSNMRALADAFLAGCLMCQHVKGGKVVMRPWAETLQCNERNGALHWDYIQLGDTYGGFKYLLVLKDEATHYCELVPCSVPSSTVTVEAILDWHSRFGAPAVWVSDQGSHFKNMVVHEVSKRLGCSQRFTLAYCPWINGSIERLNRDIVQVLRAMCLEAGIDIKDWVYFVPVLQANLNHTPLPSLGNKAPVELFCALPAATPFDFVFDAEDKSLVVLKDAPAKIQEQLDAIRDDMRMMHKRVKQERAKQAKRNQRNQRAARVANFDVGDYVLRSRVDDKHQDKLLVTWIGPYQVIGADEYSFRVRHLVTGVESDVHSSRLKFYADDSFDVTEEIREHVAAQGIILGVTEIKEHRWSKDRKCMELKVQWKGLEPIEDSWEPLASLFKDIPDMVRNYAAQQQDSKLEDALRACA